MFRITAEMSRITAEMSRITADNRRKKELMTAQCQLKANIRDLDLPMVTIQMPSAACHNQQRQQPQQPK